MTYYEIADVWEEEFLLNHENHRGEIDDNTSSISCLTIAEISNSYSNVSKYARDHHIDISEIFNSVSYMTYFGNFAHGVCTKVFRILNTQYTIVDTIPYLNILFYIVNNDLVDLHFIDYYNYTPLRSCEVLESSPSDDYSADAQVVIRILKRILDPEYSIVVLIQKNARRWLAKRKVQKMKLRNVLEGILYAPSQQIELIDFPCFPGGSLYLKSFCRFEHTSVDQLVQLCIS